MYGLNFKKMIKIKKNPYLHIYPFLTHRTVYCTSMNDNCLHQKANTDRQKYEKDCIKLVIVLHATVCYYRLPDCDDNIISQG